MFFVGGEHRGVPGAQPQGRVAFPAVGEPLRFGELHVALAAGEQHHPAAAFHGGELLVVAGHHDLAVVGAGQGEDRGHVGQRHHAGLVEDQQRAGLDRQRSQGFALPREVAEEPGGVVGAGHARLGQDVAGGLGGGQPDHVAHPGLAPDPRHFGDGPGLAGAGRARHYLGAAAGGEHEVCGGGLIQAQAGTGELADRVGAGGVRLELRFQPRLVRAEQARRCGGFAGAAHRAPAHRRAGGLPG